MIVETSRGMKPLNGWAGELPGGRMVAVLEDVRPLSEICGDFEGLTWIKAYKNTEKTICQLFEGYGTLVSAARKEDGTVQLVLSR